MAGQLEGHLGRVCVDVQLVVVPSAGERGLVR